MNMLHEAPELSGREQMVLQYIIQNFIVTANPIASRTLVDRHKLNVSPATIRSDMNNLELKGYLDHPHTSAGRVPTDLGYRFYVNSLMQAATLSQNERQIIDSLSDKINSGNIDEAVFAGARLLAKLSNLLAVNIAPKLADGIFRKIELLEISSKRLLVILTIESGLVRTIHVEVENEIDRSELERIGQFLNERMAGKILRDIKKHITEMLSDFKDADSSPLIRVFIDRADAIFEYPELRRFHFGGVEYMALQPEFSDLSQYKSIIEIVENEDLIVHLFETPETPSLSDKKVSIRIGSENNLPQMDQCSVVSANYKIGNVVGTVGLVGPKRMDYARMISLVEQLANRFSGI
jgi:heat-inducible transcriptional repressor